MEPWSQQQVTTAKGPVLLRTAHADEVYPLRMTVLIAGTDRASPEFDGDDDPHSIHVLGESAGTVVTIASWMPNRWNGEPALQLRGMATAPDWQGLGLGSALLHFCEQALAHPGGPRYLWCNARVNAVGFYLRQGWQPASDPFEIPGVGPHYRMLKELS
jgi:GNAT superfamily N-acetyltransferase